MVKNKKVRNKKAIWAFFILLTFALVMYSYPEESKNIFKVILEARITCFLVWIITVIIFVLYYFFSKDKDYNLKPIMTQFLGHFWDIIIGGIGIATGITSALTLLKGLYLQNVYGIEYFKEFDSIDHGTIFLTMAILLYFLIMRVANVAKELYWTEQMNEIE